MTSTTSLDEARRFLSLPRPHRLSARVRSGIRAARVAGIGTPPVRHVAADPGHTRGNVFTHIAALRLCAEPDSCASIRAATIAPIDDMPTETWPAMIAAVTDLGGRITGAHRTWLDPRRLRSVRLGKAPIDSPRRAMGHLLGNAVRFGIAHDVAAAGEGIETMLSLRCVLPDMPMAAALSAAHLAAILFPATLRRLYIVRDNDPAGDGAMAGLFGRAHAARDRRGRLVAAAATTSTRSTSLRHRCAAGGSAGAARPGGRRALHASLRCGRNG